MQTLPPGVSTRPALSHSGCSSASGVDPPHTADPTPTACTCPAWQCTDWVSERERVRNGIESIYYIYMYIQSTDFHNNIYIHMYMYALSKERTSKDVYIKQGKNFKRRRPSSPHSHTLIPHSHTITPHSHTITPHSQTLIPPFSYPHSQVHALAGEVGCGPGTNKPNEEDSLLHYMHRYSLC